nr:hypothetical protein [Tanacetum cinerariifolium]
MQGSSKAKRKLFDKTQSRTKRNLQNKDQKQDGRGEEIFLERERKLIEDLDTYDSDYDDILNAKEEKANKEQNNESVSAEIERYKERVKTFEQRLNIYLSSRERLIDSQMDDMIKEKLALKEHVDLFEQNISNRIKEKECLLQTFTVFKSECKEKEDKYIEKEIDLEKKIKKLDNIIFKVG